MINRSEQDTQFHQQIDAQLKRKLKAQNTNPQTVWHGLGMMGLMGWSIVMPTLLGAALGIWLDKHFPNSHSWTLALLMGGLIFGCFNAWHWLEKEQRTLDKQHENDDE